MQTPTGRLLELLELLQERPLTTGREIADHLSIDARTVRRYVEALQNLGIPVEGQRGVGGGYRIRPGYRLPPLMLTDDEAVAVALGVQAAGRLGLSGSEEAVEGALVVDALSEGESCGRSPVGIEGHGAEGVAEDVAEYGGLLFCPHHRFPFSTV